MKPLNPTPDGSVKVRGRSRSGTSKPVVGTKGVQRFQVLYKPNHIAALDRKFMAMPPIAQAIMRALLDLKKETITRGELFLCLQKTPWIRGDGWLAFTRSRPLLVREGFLGEEKAGLVKPPTAYVPRAAGGGRKKLRRFCMYCGKEGCAGQCRNKQPGVSA